MSPTAARDLSIRLAADEPDRALSVARSIKDSWFKCQALASVGRYWPDDKYGPILEEALRTAASQDNAYKVSAVSAWPIRAYLERNHSGPAKAHLVKATHSTQGIEQWGGRSEALFMLFQAARPFAPDLWQPVFRALVQAAEPSISWRQGRSVKNAAEMVFLGHPGLIQEMLRKLTDERNLSAVGRVLDRVDAQQTTPRPFFWRRESEA